MNSGAGSGVVDSSFDSIAENLGEEPIQWCLVN